MDSLIESCPVYKQMVDSQTTLAASGASIPLTSDINPIFAQALYEFICFQKPVLALEVGMAYGASSLAILSAMKKNGHAAKLISVDPVQSTDWAGAGLTSVARAGLADYHSMLEGYDYFALPKLMESGVKLDFAYIDGWHTFDYTMLDFFYIDKMLKVGGVVAYNDCDWPAVDKAINFMLTHRKYKQLDVLPAVFSSASQRRCEDRYFYKVEEWEPRWDFFAEF